VNHMERDVIHLNICHFMASVEQARDSGLRGRPVIVAAAGSARARIIDVSIEAFDEGARRGMRIPEVMRLCRGAKVVPPDPDLYERAMRAVMEEAGTFSPLCERAGTGHAFVDVTGTRRMFGPPVDAALRMRRSLFEKFRLNAGAGAASNRLMSKVAARLVKPGGLCTVMRGEERAFLEPLPVGLIPGLDDEVMTRLDALNIPTAGRLASMSVEDLAPFGPEAPRILALARGEDDTPVRAACMPMPAVSVERLFSPDTNDIAEIDRALFSIAASAGEKLRLDGMVPGRMWISVIFCDGVRLEGRVIPGGGADTNSVLYGELKDLYRKTVSGKRVRIRKISMLLDRLASSNRQMELFAGRLERERNLMHAVDFLRKRFGGKVVEWGRMAAARAH